MTRDYCIHHLINCDCFHVYEWDVHEVGEWWQHAINGQGCFVPLNEELALMTYCHIFYELRIDPPLVDGYDSDYAVYSSFRDVLRKKTTEEPNS